MAVPVVSRLRRVTRAHPHYADLVAGFAVAGLLVLSWVLARDTDPSSLNQPATELTLSISAALAGLCVAVRGFHPRLATLVAAVGSAAFSVITGGDDPGPQIALAFTSYTMALHRPRKQALPTAAAAVVLMFAAELTVGGAGPLPPEAIGILMYVAIGLAVGEATRNRRAFIAAIEERAERAEQTREEEARRRVVQERVRIARELHDVVAHHIAVINVQAGAVSHLLNRRPDQIAPAVLHIREACDSVLTELASIVGVLRQPDDPASNAPAPGLQQLPDLLESMATAGLEVATVTTGQPRRLPAVTDLAAYRIVQEALTNAHKYGVGRTDLEIRYDSDRIAISVTNRRDPRQPDAVQGSGYGLLGMSERVAAASGRLQTLATQDGHFVVQVTMPTPHVSTRHRESA